MKERTHWLVPALLCALIASVVWQFGSYDSKAVAQNAADKPLLSEYTGQSCTVHLRRDVFNGIVDVPTPKTINRLGRDELSVRGEMVVVTPDYVVIESDQRERLILPRDTVLFVELTR